jgi:hypothetical protein
VSSLTPCSHRLITLERLSEIGLRGGGRYIGILLPASTSLDSRLIETLEFGLVTVRDNDIAYVDWAR